MSQIYENFCLPIFRQMTFFGRLSTYAAEISALLAGTRAPRHFRQWRGKIGGQKQFSRLQLSFIDTSA